MELKKKKQKEKTDELSEGTTTNIKVPPALPKGTTVLLAAKTR